jgi:hypothetical protein
LTSAAIGSSDHYTFRRETTRRRPSSVSRCSTTKGGQPDFPPFVDPKTISIKWFIAMHKWRACLDTPFPISPAFGYNLLCAVQNFLNLIKACWPNRG